MTTPCASITRIVCNDREFVLVGTAHVSRQSVDEVRRAIAEERPDAVCVELDAQRHQALRDQSGWRSLNLVQVIRRGQLPFLLANLVLSSYQKRLGLTTGVRPGAELAAAAEAADQAGMPLALVDRNIRTTLLRAWRKTGFWKRALALAHLIAASFDEQKLDEDMLAKLRERDTLSLLLEEMGQVLPTMKTCLVDERDTWMAWHIRQTPGQKVLAVVGAAHVPGLGRQLLAEIDADHIRELDTIPPKDKVARALPWAIPAIVLGMFVAGFFLGNHQAMAEVATAWILITGLLSALGAALALGHPLAILTAFVAAPITTLNPTIGAGMVSGLAQALLAPPTVADLESAGDTLAHVTGWWRNRLGRVMLVFLFSTIGAASGTFIALPLLRNLIG